MTLQPLPVRISEVEDVAENVRAYTLVSVNGDLLPDFDPGSHIDLMLDNGLVRQYSLCGDPSIKTAYKIAVLREPDGRGGSEYIHQTLQQGQQISIHEPRNHFKLDEEGDNYLLLAGGIGITPIMLMAARLKQLNKRFCLHYLCHTQERAAFCEQLQQELDDQVQFHFSGGDPAKRLDIDQLFADQTADTEVYTCGPEALLQGILQVAGDKHHISVSFERFEAVAQNENQVDQAFEIEIASTRQVFQVSPEQSILDVLREQDFGVDSVCEEGICGSCEVDLLEGEAEHRDSVLSDDEKDEQSVLMVCCARAQSPRLKLDL